MTYLERVWLPTGIDSVKNLELLFVTMIHATSFFIIIRHMVKTCTKLFTLVTEKIYTCCYEFYY